MRGEALQVLSAAASRGKEYYQRTLFAPSEAQPGHCTARSPIYTANLPAGLMVQQFTRVAQGLPVERDLTFNPLLAEPAVA